MSAAAILLPVTLLSIVAIVVCCDEDTPFGLGGLHILFTQLIPRSIKRVLEAIPGGKYLLGCCCEFDVSGFLHKD
jgi:hypothetical protein